MHILVIAAILAGLIGFAFGERTARAFVAGLLTVGAVFVLLIVGIAVLDISRSEMQASKPRVVSEMQMRNMQYAPVLRRGAER